MSELRMCQREKYWSENNADEKADKCRREIYLLIEKVAGLEKAVERLMEHNHINNQLVAPIKKICCESNIWSQINKKDIPF